MRFLIAAILALFAVLPAAAQNQMQSGAGSVIKSISPNELISLLQSGGLAARYVEESQGVHFIEVNNDGAVMYFALRSCAASGQAARCGIIQPFGYFSATGVTLAQLNAFNLERPNVAFAGLNANGRGIIGAKFFLQAGVSSDHVPFSIGLFFLDLDTLVGAINPGTLASFTYEEAGEEAGLANSKIANNAPGLTIEEFKLSDGAEWRVNAVGANAPTFMTDAFRAYLEMR